MESVKQINIYSHGHTLKTPTTMLQDIGAHGAPYGEYRSVGCAVRTGSVTGLPNTGNFEPG